jgi:predicted transposase/invertase (TIGR01784 family)
VLEIDIESPEAIEFTNTELARDYEEDKLSRLDVRIKLSNQDHVDVEIQIRDRFDMINRSIYYLSKLYTDQMTKGMTYSELGRAISLNILDYNLLNEKEYFNRYRFKNTRDNTELTDIIEVDYLELRKVPNEYHSMKDMWAILLATESEEVIDMLANKNEAMHKVVEKLKYVTADDITRFQYDQRQKAELDYYAEIKRNREVGREEGIEE